MNRGVRTRLTLGLAVLAAATTLSACGMVALNAEATDTWSRHYTLSHGGTVEIHNTNGKTEIVAGDGDAVDVTATKVVRAMTDETAKSALKELEITETVTPDRIALETGRSDSGFDINFNLSKVVNYVVHVPRWANVDLRETNGTITIRDLAGSLHASATNGAIDGESLSGQT